MARPKKDPVDLEVLLVQSQVDLLEYQADLQALNQQMDASFRYGIDLAHNRICFDGGIDEYSFHCISASLATLEAKGAPEITLDLCSGGGGIDQALAILGRMRVSPVKVNVRVFGSCCSSATILLAGATGKRQISEFAVWMHHEASWGAGDRHSSHADYVERMNHEQDKWSKWLAKFSKKPAKFWKELEQSRKDHWYDPDECVKLGVADEVI